MDRNAYSIVVARYPGEEQVVLRQQGRALEYYIHRPGAPDGIGDVHVARVTAMVPAMAGAFVALADSEAFLPDTDGAAGLSVGAHLVVRLARAAQGGKGPRVAACGDEGPQSAPARLLRFGPTPLEELRAAYPDAEVTIGQFSDDLATELDQLAQPVFVLPGGMRGIVTPTAALTAIDMDGGGLTAARSPKAAAQIAGNLAALPELARQIRLRNLGGAILVDFAGVPAKRRVALSAPLQAALAPDRLRPRLASFTALGFAEILRPRLRPPLHEKTRGPLAAGLAALRQAAAQAHANPAQRLALRASPAIVTALQSDPSALADLARVMTHPLMLRCDPDLPQTAAVLEQVPL
jgi:hypothetical protein